MSLEFHPFDVEAALEVGVKIVLGLLGRLGGHVLCLLPAWLFLRGEPRVTREELGQLAPDKVRAAFAALALALLWFLAFGVFLGCTTDLRKDSSSFSQAPLNNNVHFRS